MKRLGRWLFGARQGDNELFVRCTGVDHNGFQGRDRHPTDGDIGRTFRVLSYTVFEMDHGTALVELTPDEIVGLAGFYHVFECLSQFGGRRVTFVGHEVEII